MYNVLTKDEVKMLDELLDSVGFYVEVSVYCLIFMIPLLILCVRRQLYRR